MAKLFHAGLSMHVFYVFMAVFMDGSKAADGASRGLGLLFLFAW
jgi:hypothetical protein